MFVVVLLVTLTACGGGGGGNGGGGDGGGGTVAAAPTPLTGTFIDSPVQGIGYTTATQSGTTNANGEFQYLGGETVTFNVGSVQLPPVAANTTITPLSIANTADVNHQMVSNILVFLQSLDSDGNPANGISIPTSATIAATASINFDVPPATFAANPIVTSLIANSGATTKTLVSASSAIANFQSTLTALSATASGTASSSSSSSSTSSSSVSSSPMPTAALTLSASSVDVYKTLTLTWSSTDSTMCIASGDWTGTLATSGSSTVTISSVAAKTYTLVCSNAAGSGTASQKLTVTNAQNLCVFAANPNPAYPSSYSGSFTVPAPAAHLKSSLLRIVGFKDYYPTNPDDNATLKCVPNDSFGRFAYVETLNRLQAIGVDIIEVYNYGSWDDFSKPVWTMTSNLQIPDDTVIFLISEAHKRNIKVYLAWQFGSVDVAKVASLLPNYVQGELPLSQVTQMLNSWRGLVLNKVALYGAAGLDGFKLDWDSFYVGSSPSYSSFYFSSLASLADEVKKVFSGTLYYGSSVAAMDSTLANKIAFVLAPSDGTWLTADQNNNLTLDAVKAFYQTGISNQLARIPASIPIVFSTMVQSKHDFYVTGWREDGFCISNTGAMSNDASNCTQLSYVTDFSVQSLGMEAFLETLNQQSSSRILGLNFSTSYWLTDNLTPYPAFPNTSQSFRNKPAEQIIKYWFAR